MFNPLRILRLGMPMKQDALEDRRLLLLNLFFLVASATILASVIDSYIANEPRAIQYAHFVALFILCSVPFLTVRNSYVASVIMVLIANAIIFFFCNAQGFESGTYIFYFPMFFANGWLMDFRKPLYCAFLLAITMLSVIFVVLLPQELFGITISEGQKRDSFSFNLICAALVMAINTIVIVWMNHRRQMELEDEVASKVIITRSLAEALKEKEVLIAEIHHRVKNNLAVVRGLLNLQMHTTTNETAKETLRESVSRVTAMALIHQKLYSNQHIDVIDLDKYVRELVAEVSTSYHLDGHLAPTVNTHVEKTSLDINQAVPCGLILNELLTNAFKHAFSNGKHATINISIGPDSSRPGFTSLVVSDNGIGIAENVDPDTTDSLGMTIIRSLSEQLDGSFSFKGEPNLGTRAVITFPSGKSAHQ